MEAYSEWMFSIPKFKETQQDLFSENLVFKQDDIDFYLFCIKVIYRKY